MTNEKQTIDLTVSSPNAVEKVQAMLGGYDIDEENVSRVSIGVFEHTEDETPDTQTNGDSEMDVEADGRTIGDNERKLAPIYAETSYHVVLAAVEEHDGDTVSATDLAESGMVDHVSRNSISKPLSILYKRRLLDRNEGSYPYEYWLTEHGEAQLNDIGRDVDLEAIGGDYAPN